MFISLKNDNVKTKTKRWLNDSNNYLYLTKAYENTRHQGLLEYHELIKNLISTNFVSLFKISAFDSLDNECFMELFDKKFVESKIQANVIDTITRWVDYDFKSRKTYWLELINLVDFTNISNDYIKKYTLENPKIYQYPELAQFFVTLMGNKMCQAVQKVPERDVEALTSIITPKEYFELNEKYQSLEPREKMVLTKIHSELKDQCSKEQVIKTFFECNQNIDMISRKYGMRVENMKGC